MDNEPDTLGVEAADKPLPDEVDYEAESTPAVETDDVKTETADDTGAEEPKPEEAEEKPKREPWFQKRINEITADKYEQQRRADQLQAQIDALKQPEQTTQEGPPTLEEYNWDETAYQKANAEYFDNLATDKVKTMFEQQKQQDSEQTQLQQIQGKLNDAALKYSDFSEVAERIPNNEAVQQFMLNADNAADVLHEIGSDPAEAHRVFSLPPYLQAAEFGKTAARLEQPKSKTIAPPPPKTVRGMSAGASKAPEDMTIAEYREWRNKQS